MYKKVKLLTKDDKNLKVNKIEDFKYANELTQSIITVDEFFKASKSQPIVFAQRGEEYFASIVLGLEEGKNSFINSKNEWIQGEYIPAYVRRYPFIFVQENETLALAYDEACKEINTQDGESFFTPEGEQTEYVTNVMKFMENFQKSSQTTALFIKDLENLGLLEDANANMSIDGKKFAFTGFKRVNEEKLNSLSEEQTMKLIKNGSYKLIVAHLISMSNFEKLISLHK